MFGDPADTRIGTKTVKTHTIITEFSAQPVPQAPATPQSLQRILSQTILIGSTTLDKVCGLGMLGFCESTTWEILHKSDREAR
jgi:hypothetical protein